MQGRLDRAGGDLHVAGLAGRRRDQQPQPVGGDSRALAEITDHGRVGQLASFENADHLARRFAVIELRKDRLPRVGRPHRPRTHREEPIDVDLPARVLRQQTGGHRVIGRDKHVRPAPIEQVGRLDRDPAQSGHARYPATPAPRRALLRCGRRSPEPGPLRPWSCGCGSHRRCVATRSTSWAARRFRS